MGMKSFIIEQKITAFANQYRIYEAGETDKDRKLVAFAHQKRLAFKEEVIFYTDESKKDVCFTVKAEKKLDIHGKFIIRDAKGKEIGAVRKAFTTSLLRSTWEILEKGEPAITVQERSQFLAVFRRIWGFIPFIGDIPYFILYHFDFVNIADGSIAASYSKTTLLVDHYRLDIQDDSLVKRFGWETLVTQGVLLDALQGR